MKIYDSNINGASASGAQRTGEAQPAERAGRTSSVQAGGSDRVEFSGALGRLSQSLMQFQTDRASRVQALSDQYRNGTYRPDAAVISRSMISDALSAGGEAAF